MEQLTANRQSSKRSRFINILIIIFVLVFVRELFDLIRYSDVTDYALLDRFGLGALYVVYTSATVVVIGIATTLLFKKHSKAFYFSFASLILYLFGSFAMFVISLTQRDYAKAAYVLSREARGLAVPQESLDFSFSLAGMAINFGIYFVVFALLLVGLLRNKKYFDRNQTDRSLQTTT